MNYTLSIYDGQAVRIPQTNTDTTNRGPTLLTAGRESFYFTSQNFTAKLKQRPHRTFIAKIEHQVRKQKERAVIVDHYPCQEGATGTGGPK